MKTSSALAIPTPGAMILPLMTRLLAPASGFPLMSGGPELYRTCWEQTTESLKTP